MYIVRTSSLIVVQLCINIYSFLLFKEIPNDQLIINQVISTCQKYKRRTNAGEKCILFVLKVRKIMLSGILRVYFLHNEYPHIAETDGGSAKTTHVYKQLFCLHACHAYMHASISYLIHHVVKKGLL